MAHTYHVGYVLRDPYSGTVMYLGRCAADRVRAREYEHTHPKPPSYWRRQGKRMPSVVRWEWRLQPLQARFEVVTPPMPYWAILDWERHELARYGRHLLNEAGT